MNWILLSCVLLPFSSYPSMSMEATERKTVDLLRERIEKYRLHDFVGAPLCIISVVLGALLAVSGINHLLNPFFFAQSIDGYQLAGPTLKMIVAAVIPAVQIVLACFLLTSTWKRTISLLTATMFLAFAVLQFYALATDLSISCGCFGFSIEEISIKTAAIPTVCFAGAGLVAFYSSDDPQHDENTEPFDLRPDTT